MIVTGRGQLTDLPLVLQFCWISYVFIVSAFAEIMIILRWGHAQFVYFAVLADCK